MIESYLFFNQAPVWLGPLSLQIKRALIDASRSALSCTKRRYIDVPWWFNIHLPSHSWCVVKPAPLASRSLLSHLFYHHDALRTEWIKLEHPLDRGGRPQKRILTGTYGISYGRSLPIRSNVKSDPTARTSLDASSRWRDHSASQLRTRCNSKRASESLGYTSRKPIPCRYLA